MALPEIEVRIDGDPSGSVNALQQTSDAVERLETDLAKGSAAAKKFQSSTSTINRALPKMNRSMRASTAHTANLAAQFNDIGVMLAAGQSPLMLAVQQGSQINQVFTSMGGTPLTKLKAMTAGIRAMINPMSLATFAVIAGVAALVNFARTAFGASEEVKGLADRLEDVNERMDELRENVEALRLGVTTEELAVLDAIANKQREIADLEREIADIQAESGQFLNSKAIVNAKKAELQVLKDQLLELQNLQTESDNLKGKLSESAAETRLVYEGMQLAADQMEKAQGYADLMAQGLNNAQITALELAGIDIASPISAAAREAAVLATNLGISLNQAISLQNLRAGMTYSGRGSNPNKFGDPFCRSAGGRRWGLVPRRAVTHP